MTLQIKRMALAALVAAALAGAAVLAQDAASPADSDATTAEVPEAVDVALGTNAAGATAAPGAEAAEPQAEAPAEGQQPAAAEPAPMIEELQPAAEAAEKPAAKPAEPEAKAEVPVIEELEPAAKPAEAPAEKPAEAAPAAQEAKPAEAPGAEPAPAAPAPEEAKPAPKAEAPAAAEQAALEEAVSRLGSEERRKAAEVLAQQEEVRRQERELAGKKGLEKADAAYRSRDFAAAVRAYREVLAKLPDTDANRDARRRAAQRVPDCEYEMALALYKAGRTKDALEAAKAAQAGAPQHGGLRKLVAHLEAELAAAPRERPPRELPEEDRVGDLMRAGASYMAVRDYEKARESFEAVLAIAPENREAMRYLKELQDRRYVANSIERKATVAKMTAQVRDAWNPPQYKAIRARGPEKPPPPPTEIPLLVKMDKIIIESIEFRQANIHDVVEFLNKAAREGDKEETDESKKGVNIILNLNPGGQVGPAAAPAPAAGQGDIFNLGPAPGGGAAGGATYEITFSARYISLLSALKIITKVAGLKYLIEGNIVMIVPADYEPGEIVVKMYPVEPTFVERIRETAPARRERGGEFRPMETPELETGLPDLKAYFENMGVPFPKGSSITYNSGIGKVIVANTSENLAKFEQILAELNVVPKQVEIEARFVEVNETDLQELGLEWLLNDNWEIASKANGAPLSGRPRIQMNANASQGGFTRGVRFFGTQAGVQSPTVEPVAAGGGTLGRVLSIASVLTNPELGMVLHLLEQNGNADLLSAPKVTTRSGAEASIRVVTEYIYPTSFRVEGGQIQTGTAGLGTVVQETTVTPEDFETREVGVILQVLPEVSPDGTTINLTMTPSVVTEPIWWNYGSTVRRSDQSEIQLYMPQPFFKVRTLTTQISIYDGATVVMGGLMTEDVKKINDKIPVLGDVPLIGGLFRNAGERSEKKNLLIFVTAKLVDPAGQLIRKTETAAVPAPVPAPQP